MKSAIAKRTVAGLVTATGDKKKDGRNRPPAVSSRPHHPTVAQHSISTRAPSASPLAPSALRAGLFVGK